MFENKALAFVVAALLTTCGVIGMYKNIRNQINIKKNINVAAQNNSVAIGNNNSGKINLTGNSIVSTAQDTNGKKNTFFAVWNIICGIATLLGLYIGYKAL